MPSELDKRLRVLITSTSYPADRQDWRGRFIADLVEAMSNSGRVDVDLWAPPGQLPEGVTSVASEQEARWLGELMAGGGMAHHVRNRGPLALGVVGRLLSQLWRVYRRSKSVDVVHVNWLQNALPLFGTRQPAVISVLGSDFGWLRLPGMTFALRAVFRQRKCVLAPNAEWMRAPLERLFGDLAPVRPIPFGVDRRWFQIQRHIDASVGWVVVSRVTRNKLGYLMDWGEEFFGAARPLHLFGPMQEQIALPAWIDYHGPTHPQALLTEWFPRASGLLTLSVHDEGRPQVMLEAMAAGLPILASDLPAHRDFISHGETGWLADTPASLGQGLRHLEDAAANVQVGAAARAWVKQTVGTWDDCAGRYELAYRSVAG